MNLRLLVSYDFVEFFHFYLSISLRDARSKIDGRETPRAVMVVMNEKDFLGLFLILTATVSLVFLFCAPLSSANHKNQKCTA